MVAGCSGGGSNGGGGGTTTPSISGLNPSSGAVGTSVTITGTNFGASQGVVTFNGTAGTPTSWSATSIVVPVPSGATSGGVIVTIGGVASNAVSFTVLLTPNIASLNLTSAAVGTAVTITGTNFGTTQGTSTVTFGGTAGTPTSWSATSIVVPVPAGATSGNVVVTVSGVPSNGVVFTVLATPSITSLNPTSAPVSTAITITGSNFGSTQGTSAVTFNGVAGTPTSWSTTSIVVPVPAGATSGNVVVTVSGVPSNGVVFTVLATPSITSLNPTSAPVSASVTITGTNFGATQGSSTVKFNGTAGTPTSWSATSITVPVPTGATSGNVVVTVAGVASNGVLFTVAGTPSITSLNPTSAAVGTVATITGTNFGTTQGTSTVTFGGTAGTPTSWSATSIVVPVPAGATSGNVVVTVSGVPSNGVVFTVLATPSITSLNPTSAPVSASVTITGTNFGATQGSSTVKFNGTAGTPTSWSATSITVPVPTGATSGNVVVTVAGVASNGVLFTVAGTPSITSLNPTSAAVGTAVTITGSNFGTTQGSSTLKFNGTTATPSSWSATSITAPVPAGATTGNVVVTVSGVASNGVAFTVLATPNIISLNPTSASEGTAVTITGTNFGATQGSSTVTFNGTAGTPTSWSAISITVPVPTGATTGNVVVTVSGVPSNAVSLTVIPTPSISSLNPTFGPIGTSVTITGTNFGTTQGISTVTFGGTAGTPTSWSATSIVVPVPAGATTGNVVVTVTGVASNGVSFTVTPGITNLNPTSGTVGALVTITGTSFGASQGSSTVKFNGTSTAPTSWSATGITAPVPAGATTGNVVVTVGGVASNGVTFTVTPPGAPLSDDFHGNTLNPMWTFYANCCGFENTDGTDVLLTVPSATNHNIYGQNQGVGLLQNISDVDFEVEAKFDSLVTQGDQEEGIFVQQDAQNFLFFGTYNDGSSTHIYQIVTIGGTPTSTYDQTISTSGSAFWIRLNRTGSTWTQSWSSDGTTFTPVSPLSQSLTVSAIGPAAGNKSDASNDPAPSFTAAVDYFFNTASPISPADGGLAPPANYPVFKIWYGDTQNFGQNGVPQEQVNILGNISAPSGIQSAFFTVNADPTQYPLRVGAYPSRLADTGDFNVEICRPNAAASCGAPVSLQAGANTIVISATDNLNNTKTHTVTVNWSTGQTWPIPYAIDWSTVTNIQDVAQIVDGQWAIQPDGTVRTKQVGFDRQIALGDVTWTDYQVVTEMTINQLDCTTFGAGIVVGWSGNTLNSSAPQPDQPTSYLPLYALGWYASYGSAIPPNSEMAIYANSTNYPDQVLIADNSGFKPTVGVKYIIKLTAQRNGNNTASHYTLEIWPSGTPEPLVPLIQADGDPNLGSVLLLANHADVSFGKILVCAIGTTCTLP